MRTTLFLLSALLLLSSSACAKKKEAPPATPPAAAAAAPPDAAVADAAPPATAAPAKLPAPTWTRGTGGLQHLCGYPADVEGSYADALKKGRKAAAGKDWPAAAEAFKRALLKKLDDPAALSEASVASLQLGDAETAVGEAEQAAISARDPKLQAAAYYNAGRAAEALGDLDRARKHYQLSLELRDNEAVRQRMQTMTAPQVKTLVRSTPRELCAKQPTLAALCDCVTETETGWSKGLGVTKDASCAPLEGKAGKVGAILEVKKKADVPEELIPGEVLLLAFKRGDTWSALTDIEDCEDNDLTMTPKNVVGTEVHDYQELPVAGGTLLWAHTSHSAMETSGGETQAEGMAKLTLCVIPDDAAKPPFCSDQSLGVWAYTFEPGFEGDDQDKCENRLVSLYRASLDSNGEGSLILMGGTDEGKQAGRFRVQLTP